MNIRHWENNGVKRGYRYQGETYSGLGTSKILKTEDSVIQIIPCLFIYMYIHTHTRIYLHSL